MESKERFELVAEILTQVVNFNMYSNHTVVSYIL